MKNLSFWRAAVLMLAPVVVLVGMVFLPMGSSSSAATPTPTTVIFGNVAVAFSNTPNPNFQSILFNVASVRLNPSTDPAVSDFDPNWVTLSVPSGVGINSGVTTDPFLALSSFFNTSSSVNTPGNAGTGPTELQVDINQLQGSAQLFNTVMVPVNTYNQVEVILDLYAPGYVIPLCSGTIEGCIQYPMALTPGAQVYVRTSAVVTVSSPNTTTLVVNLNAGQIGAPNSWSGYFITNPTITAAVSNPGGGPVGQLGQISGTVLGASTVTAELSGTNQVVATTPNGSGTYLLLLPATVNTGTLYDVVASGPNATFDARKGVLVTQGVTTNLPLGSGATGNVSLSGTVTDACSTLPIQAAIVDILAPPASNPSANCIATPGDCVVVASGQTQDTGVYPMPGSNYFTPPFTNMPQGNYFIRVSAAGYDTVVSSLNVSPSGASCGSGSGGVCNFALASASMGGTVSVSPGIAAGSPPLNVMVMAEDHGTNHIENVATTAIQPGASTANFAMKVPTINTVGAFDVFSSVQDTFNGAPQNSTGHTLGVVSNLGAIGACGTFSIPATAPLSTMQCVGHGSIVGVTTGSPVDSYTTVELSKAAANGSDVAFSEAQVNQLSSTNPTTQFSFCAPADPAGYFAQRFEAGPGASPSPAASPTVVPMAAPTVIPGQTCPTICSNGSGLCTVCNLAPAVTVP